MHTFAERPKATQHFTSAKPTISGRANSILRLQRTIGNQALSEIIAGGDAHEIEADRTADEVVRRLSDPRPAWPGASSEPSAGTSRGCGCMRGRHSRPPDFVGAGSP